MCLLVEPQVQQNGDQIEKHRERVLLFADPGHRGHVDRMHRKHQPGQPRSRNLQPSENHPDQHGVGGVQEHIDRMVAERVRSPQSPLHPPQTPGQRIVIGSLRREPEPMEPIMRFDHSVIDDQRIIIKDKAGTQGGQIGQNSQQDDESRASAW